MAHGIIVPWPGIEPMSLALEGGVLTTGSPGKALDYFLKMQIPWHTTPTTPANNAELLRTPVGGNKNMHFYKLSRWFYE